MHPILFEIGHFPVRAYGVMIAVAVLAGLWLAGKEAERKGFEKERIYDFAFYVVLSGILGARLYYVLFTDPERYMANPLRLLAFWEGGLAIHGAILAGFLASLWYTCKWKLSFWKWADTLTPSLILGQAIGRIACFLNGDAHGYPTDLPWGMVYAANSPAGEMYPGLPLHPTQLYEMAFNWAIFLILWKLRKKNFLAGFLFLIYVVLYSSIRIFVENFRADQLTYGGGISTAQTLGFIAIAISLGILIFRIWREKGFKTH